MGGAKPFARRKASCVADRLAIYQIPGFRPPMLSRHKLFGLRRLLHVVLAVAACGATSAFAQGNAANGATLYAEKVRAQAARTATASPDISETRVSRVHRSDDPRRHPSRHQRQRRHGDGRVSEPPWTPQKTSDVAAYLLAAVTPPPPPPFAPLPTPTASPSRVTFPSTAVGATSAPIGVLLTNSAGTAITLGNPAVNPSTGRVPI